jgi:S1-C subfamily serine protease
MNRHFGRFLIIFPLALLVLVATGAKADAAQKPWLGVYMQNVTDQLAEAFDLQTTHGVLVNDVVADSPAEKAGLREGDVIVAWNGKDVENSNDLVDLVNGSKVGDRVELTVIREGKKDDLRVDIGEREQLQRYFRKDRDQKLEDLLSPKTRGIGVSLQSLSGDLCEYFALVTKVFEDSPAQKAGLKAGDVILSVDNEEVHGPADVSYAVGDKKVGDEVNLNVVRDHEAKDFTVTIGEYESPYARSLEELNQAPNASLFNQFHSVPFQYRRYQGEEEDNAQLENRIRDLEREMQRLQERMKDLQERLK